VHQNRLYFRPFRRQQSAYQDFGRYFFCHSSLIETPILLAQGNVLAMKGKAHYPVTHIQIKKFTAISWAQQIFIDNAFLGHVPQKILIAFVKTTSFVGSASTNPFYFHHYDMTNHVLFVNGVQKPSEPLTMDCSSTFDANSAYETLFSSTGIQYDDRAHINTLEMFTKSFYVLGFDLTPDREVDEELTCLPCPGNLRVEARLKKPFLEPVTWVLYAEFPGHIEIDKSRNIILE